jgi:hypothetical protein
MTSAIKIFDIKVGRRHRNDLGDIAGLAASIGKIGLLYPIVTSDTSSQPFEMPFVPPLLYWTAGRMSRKFS